MFLLAVLLRISSLRFLEISKLGKISSSAREYDKSSANEYLGGLRNGPK